MVRVGPSPRVSHLAPTYLLMRILIGLVAALLLPGCASQLNKGRATMVLHSEPSGAAVLVNGNERGRTP